MQMTPAIKGQLTKATTKGRKAVQAVFMKLMPREQAKHATRKFLSKLAVGIIAVSLGYHGPMPTVKAPVYVNLGQSQYVNSPVVPTVVAVRVGR